MPVVALKKGLMTFAKRENSGQSANTCDLIAYSLFALSVLEFRRV